MVKACTSCGQQLAPGDLFCGNCGTKVIRPRKSPNFEAAEERFFALKGKHSSGLLSDEEYETTLQELVIWDDHGRSWMIGAKTGQWYYHDGKDWIMAEPPEEPAAPAAQPPEQGIPWKRAAIGCGAILAVATVFACALGFPWLLQSGYLPLETTAQFGEPTLSFTEIPSPTASETHVAALPSLSVDPAVAEYGTRVSISGSGWQPGETVSLEYHLPDGESISGGQATADEEGNTAFADWVSAEGDPLGIYVVAATGTESGIVRSTFEVVESTRGVIAEPTAVVEPESPPPLSMSKIAFVNYDQGGDTEIFVMDSHGANVTQLTRNDAYDMSPSWSPDGSKIAFSSEMNSDNSQIWVMEAGGSGLQQLTSGAQANIEPDWSPDGLRVAFTSYRDGNANIYVMNSDGSDQRRLTDHEGFDDEAAWSPDGQRITFMSDRSESSEIFVMNADGTQVTQLTDDGRYQKTVSAWSPNGQRIAVDGWDSESQRHQIFLMNPDGSDFEYLVDGRDPSWAPDGGYLAYDHFEITTLDMATMQEVGLTQGKMFHGGGVDWSDE